MSISQRLQRESILGQRTGGGRGTGQRAPTYRGELLHKRDEYGTSMDDQQYEAMNKNQADFRAKISKAEGDISNQAAKVQGMYNEQKSQIDSASYDRPEGPGPLNLPSKEAAFDNFWSTDTAIVRATHGNTVYKTWEVPKSVMPDLESSFNKGDGSYVANWVDGGKFYNIDTEPQGVGSEYGLELGSALDKLKSQAKSAFYESGTYEQQAAAAQAQYDSAVGEFNYNVDENQKAFDISKDSAYSVLNRDYTVAQETLASSRNQVSAAKRQNQDALNTIRNKYSRKIEGVRQTLTELFGDKNE